jgi:hypothetical protein
MTTRKLIFEIARLMEKVRHLKQSRNWYRYPFSESVRDFQEHHIAMPWLPDLQPEKIPLLPGPEPDDGKGRFLAPTKYQILQDIITNSSRPPEHFIIAEVKRRTNAIHFNIM